MVKEPSTPRLARPQAAQLSITFSLPAKVRKKGKWYIASCPPLDLFSQGETKAKAIDNLNNALTEFLLSCYERGTVGQVLRQARFVPTPGASMRKPKLSRDTVPLTVEMPFVIQDDPPTALSELRC